MSGEKVDNKVRLDVLKKEEQMIAEEKEELLQEEEEKRKKVCVINNLFYLILLILYKYTDDIQFKQLLFYLFAWMHKTTSFYVHDLVTFYLERRGEGFLNFAGNGSLCSTITYYYPWLSIMVVHHDIDNFKTVFIIRAFLLLFFSDDYY